MEKIQLGQWKIEVDKAKTTEFYSGHRLISEDCKCTYCKNYVQACAGFSDKVIEFFNFLGIDPKKGAEVYECGNNKDGNYTYGGIYHFVGTIQGDKDYWRTVRKTESGEASTVDTNSLIRVDNFNFGFSHRIALVPKNFPDPVAQMEFNANIPWVIDEKAE